MKRQHTQVQSVVAAVLFMLGTACSNDLPVVPEESLTVYKLSGDRQIGIAGEELPRGLQIQVRTSSGPVFDAVVSLEVTGGGTTTPETVRTDSRGNALIRWTLGEAGGWNTLMIRVAGADSRTFTATGVAVDVDDRYYHGNEFGAQVMLGLNDAGQFIAIDPNSCSAEGTYEISGSQIAFQVQSATPGSCAALPAPTGLIEGGDIVFELLEYDPEWGEWGDVTGVRRLVYVRSTP